MSVHLTVAPRGGKIEGTFPIEVNVPEDATLRMIKTAVARLSPSLTVARQRITKEDRTPLVGDDKLVRDLNLRSGDRLYVKDLGPQVGWRTVFFVEYVRCSRGMR